VRIKSSKTPAPGVGAAADSSDREPLGNWADVESAAKERRTSDTGIEEARRLEIMSSSFLSASARHALQAWTGEKRGAPAATILSPNRASGRLTG
jgi:hypothetical protein